MSKVNALVQLTIPGTIENVNDSPIVKQILLILDSMGIEHKSFDSVQGWGSLNQDWIEFKIEVDTDYGWCSIVPFEGLVTDDYHDFWKEYVWPALHYGKLLMKVYYIEEENGVKKYIPHR